MITIGIIAQTLPILFILFLTDWKQVRREL